MARTGGWRHLLIVALIAVAVAAAVGVGVSVRSSDLPDEVALAGEFGAADLRLSQYAGDLRFADLPGELQQVVRDIGLPTAPDRQPIDVGSIVGETLPEAELLRAESGYTFSVEAGQVWLWSLNVDHRLADGLLQIDGPAPGPGQALLSPALLAESGAQVGDTIDLFGAGQVEVVGTAQDPRRLRRPLAVLPEGAEPPGVRNETVWFADVPGQADPMIAERLRDAFRRHGTQDQSVGVRARFEEAERLDRDRELTQTPTFIGAVVGTALLLQVAFVSAAAFATGTRRRLRDLGLLGAVGASPDQVRGVVMREAAVLGTVGALAGLALGMAGASTVGVWIVERFAGNPVFAIQWHPADLALPPVLGLFAALAAAYLPARTAGRVPVTTALAGRLPVSDVPRWVTPLAFASVAGGLVVLAATRRGGTATAGDDLIVGATFLATAIGAAALAVPLLALLGRVADRLPARVRLAVRDTVRQRTRSAAAVAALTVVLIVPVLVAISAATDAARWSPPQDLRRDIASVAGPHYHGVQLPPTQEMIDTAEGVLPAVEQRVTVTRLLSSRTPGESRISLFPVEDPVDGAAGAPHPPDQARYQTNYGSAALATPQLLEQLGLSHLQEQVDDGAVLGLWMPHLHREPPMPDGPIAIIDGDGPGDVERGAPSATVPLIVAQPTGVTWDLPEILVPPSVADQLELATVDASVLLDLQRPLDNGLVHKLEQVGTSSTVPFQIVGSSTAYQPSPTGTIGLAVGIALVVALIISGMTAALAATESDHDLELITAVGAAPSIRRRFHGWQAGYHALIAAVLAVPTGLLIYRAAAIRTADRPWMELPGWWLAAIILAVPIAIGLTHAALMRSAHLRAPRRIA